MEDQHREFKVGIGDPSLWVIPTNQIFPYILQPFKASHKVAAIVVWVDPKPACS